MFIKENGIYGNENIQLRVLYVENEYVGYIRFDKERATPRLMNIGIFEIMIQDEGLRLETQAPISFFNESLLSTKQIEMRNKIYEYLSNIWDNDRTQFFIPSAKHDIYEKTAEMLGLSTDQIKRYLARWFQQGRSINALVPQYQVRNKELTMFSNKVIGKKPSNFGRHKTLDKSDENNFNWAYKNIYLNNPNCTKTYAYHQMINERYRNKSNGLYYKDIPSKDQFKYWFKTRHPHDSAEEIARKGVRKFNITSRQRTSDPNRRLYTFGSEYQIDSTIADIHLVSTFNRQQPVGRPTIYYVVDAYSSLIVGLHISMQPSCKELLLIAFCNAVDGNKTICEKYGLKEIAFPAKGLPASILSDRSEYLSFYFDSIKKYTGITKAIAPPGRGDLKAYVERKFNKLNKDIGRINKGVITPLTVERQAEIDPIEQSNLTLSEYTRQVYKAVETYNLMTIKNKTILDQDVLSKVAKLSPVGIYEYARDYNGINLDESITGEYIARLCVPSKEVIIGRDGIRLNRLIYIPKDDDNDFVKRLHENVKVFVDSRCINRIAVLNEKGCYEEWILISRYEDFRNCSLEEWMEIIQINNEINNLNMESDYRLEEEMISNNKKIAGKAEADKKKSEKKEGKRAKTSKHQTEGEANKQMQNLEKSTNSVIDIMLDSELLPTPEIDVRNGKKEDPNLKIVREFYGFK